MIVVASLSAVPQSCRTPLPNQYLDCMLLAVYTHTEALQAHHTRAARSSWFTIGGVGWGGVGWDNNVHVPVHTQARQAHHTRAARSSWFTIGGVGWDGVGWGGIITFMFLYTHRHSKLITQELHVHHGSLLGGGVGWDNNVHVPVHTQAGQAHHTRAARSSLLSIETCCPQENLRMMRAR